jgi:hypothetical protein
MNQFETFRSNLGLIVIQLRRLGLGTEEQRLVFLDQVTATLNRLEAGEDIDSNMVELEKLWTGMGGASGTFDGEPEPMIDPRERNVHDEILDDTYDERSVSVSRSDGVGSAVDPETAVYEINDPAIRSRWWQPKIERDPQPHPLPPAEANLRKAT